MKCKERNEIGSSLVTPPACDLASDVAKAASIIERDEVQKLISSWRVAGIPIQSVEANVRDGRAVIRIVVKGATQQNIRHLPYDVEGFLVVVEEQRPTSLH